MLRDGGREGSFKETIEFVEAVIASGMDTIRLFEDHIIGLGECANNVATKYQFCTAFSITHTNAVVF